MPELRDRLVKAAVRAVERDGPEELSLRRIASDAGVSHQAPYLCFADKRAMLAAVAAVAMGRDRAGWERAMSGATKPLARLLALVRAHIRFARRHPNLHALVVGPYVAKSDLAVLHAEAMTSFALLRSTVGACLPDDAPIERQRQCTVILWAAVKGLVDLDANRQIPTSVPGGLDDLVEEAVRALIVGWSSESATWSRAVRSR